MESQSCVQPKLTREVFFQDVLSVVRLFPVRIYGSFCNFAFHLNSQDRFTFSDIDLIIANNESPRRLETIRRSIQTTILEKTEVQIRVSLRERQIHTGDLSPEVSHRISIFETLYRAHKSCHPQMRRYQLIKLCYRLLADRLFAHSIYDFKQMEAAGFSHDLALKMRDLKFGEGDLSEFEVNFVGKKIVESCPIAVRPVESLSRKGSLFAPLSEAAAGIITDSSIPCLLRYDVRKKMDDLGL